MADCIGLPRDHSVRQVFQGVELGPLVVVDVVHQVRRVGPEVGGLLVPDQGQSFRRRGRCRRR